MMTIVYKNKSRIVFTVFTSIFTTILLLTLIIVPILDNINGSVEKIDLSMFDRKDVIGSEVSTFHQNKNNQVKLLGFYSDLNIFPVLERVKMRYIKTSFTW